MTYPQLLLAHTIAERTNLISISLSHTLMMMMMITKKPDEEHDDDDEGDDYPQLLLACTVVEEPILSVSYTCGDDDKK